MQNPIEQAVLPLKSDAVQRAEQDAKQIIANVEKNLSENGWDINIVSPYPSTNISWEEFVLKNSRRKLYMYLTTKADSQQRGNSLHGAYIVKMNPATINMFIEESERMAEIEYDEFVFKLNNKIGEVVDAELSGNHVWGYSILTVTLPNGEVQRWKTQQIVNTSKLGKLFNQWPSRKIK